MKHRLSIFAGMLVAAALLSMSLPRALPAHAAGSVTLPHATVPQGASVTVSGTGFTAGDTVTVAVTAPVYNHNQNIQTSVAADGSGNFSTHLNLPRGINPGTYKLTASDTHGVTASQNVTVWALLVLRANGTTNSIKVADRHGYFVDLLGFDPNETVNLDATFPSYSGNNIVQSRTPTTDSHGSVFAIALTVPAEAKVGWANVSAKGQNSGKTASGRVYVAYYPYIYPNHKTFTPGSWFEVLGRGFVSYATIHVSVTIGSGNGNTQTLSVDASADKYGNFGKWMRLPNYTTAGTYTITAVDSDSGFKRYARITVNTKPTPKATATPTTAPKPTATAVPSGPATIRVFPGVTLPNQTVTLAGDSFPANAGVTIDVTFAVRGGGQRTVSSSTSADSNGGFTADFHVPWKAAPGTYSVHASAGNSQASGRLKVLALSAHPSNLQFQWVSLWYHTVRQGTWDYVTVQSTLHTELGIWVHVIFPNGGHLDIYTNTNHSGRWSVKFNIPGRAASSRSNQAYVTFQLWHGSRTTQSFMDFTLV